MKNYKILAFFLVFALIAGSCEDTNENLVGSRGVGVVPTVSNLNPAVFDSNDLQNTFIQFDVSIEDQSNPENAIVKVSFNGQKERVNYQTITSFPATVQLSLKEAASKLGMDISQIQLGDVINVEVWTTVGGKSYPTSTAFNAAVVCAYNPNNVTGSYHAFSAGWGSEGNITITVDPNDPFTVYVKGLEEIEGLVEDKDPLKMVINSLDYSVTAVKTVIASDAWGYHNIAYQGTGTLSTCDGTYQMLFSITVDEGSFGTYAFTLTKN